MILYCSVGLQEMELIYDNGMRAFPVSLPQQPALHPVRQLDRARQIASGWNTRNGQFAGYVTQFKVDDQYLSKLENHIGDEAENEDLQISAAELAEFNQHINGHIKVVAAYFGDAFEGYVPEKFGLQGKNAVEQLILLVNSFLYKRMDFYLEIRRNHKAVFLNYPFWQKYDFKNQGLKEKMLQAIKEVWFTSFPNFPLPLPVQENTPLIKKTGSSSPVHPIHDDIEAEAHTEESQSAMGIDEDTIPVKQTGAHTSIMVEDEGVTPVYKPDPRSSGNAVPKNRTPVEEINAHFSQGLQFGLSGQYVEAIEWLSRAVEEDPGNVIAQTSLGVAFHRSGQDDRALSCYETALRTDPIYAEAHYFRANILYRQGNVREAIAGYTIAIGLNPALIEAPEKPIPQDRLTDYTRSPAEMYWIARPAHRILELDKAVEADPRQAGLFKERAAEYYRLRNYVRAIADYSASLEKGPPDANVFHFRGVAYEQIGQFDRALEDYQRAIAIDPQLAGVYINRGIAFGKTGNFRQSIASFSESIRLAPGNPDGYFNRGMSYYQQGDIESAIDDFSNVIRLSPGDEAAYYWRGMSHEEAGRQREAIADYRQFLALSQDANAREQIEQKLSQWNAGKPGSATQRSTVPGGRQKMDPAQSEKTDQERDLYRLIVALGKRAITSTWLGSGVDCRGEKAEELSALTDQDKPIDGRHLLRIASGIRQTIKGDFQAFDPGETSPWIFIRAWHGDGFYVETNDPTVKERLKTHFPVLYEVDGASPPYESLFIAPEEAPS